MHISSMREETPLAGGKEATALIVFDCDGVLVDSEMLSAAVLMEEMERAGLPITFDIFRSDFLGRSVASASARTLERFGRPLPDDFAPRYSERLLARMRRDLRPMAGVEEMLNAVRLPYCLATSSSPERLAVTLSVTGLARWFEGRCFTSLQVTRGKPAPDLFLFAASKFGIEPARALVIEDSEMGVRAGLAAGMPVWHFAGGSHIRAGVRLPGEVMPARVVSTMAELGQALAAIS